MPVINFRKMPASNFRREYLRVNLHEFDIRREAKEEGITEGARENAIKNARNLIKMNLLSAEQIAEATELSIEDIKVLTQETPVS